MPDKYGNFAELSLNERSGVDYRILVRQAEPEFVIVSPHGGGIEPGTSEIADAIAAEEHSFYDFEGLKPKGNSDLHITSTNFDERMCFTLIGRSEVVLTIHGEHSEEDGDGIFVGGLDTTRGRRLGRSLKEAGFVVGRHKSSRLQGLEPTNLCNRGESGKGVQLEISKTVREQLFESLTRTGRKHPTPKFTVLVNAIRRALV